MRGRAGKRKLLLGLTMRDWRMCVSIPSDFQPFSPVRKQEERRDGYFILIAMSLHWLLINPTHNYSSRTMNNSINCIWQMAWSTGNFANSLPKDHTLQVSQASRGQLPTASRTHGTLLGPSPRISARISTAHKNSRLSWPRKCPT